MPVELLTVLNTVVASVIIGAGNYEHYADALNIEAVTPLVHERDYQRVSWNWC